MEFGLTQQGCEGTKDRSWETQENVEDSSHVGRPPTLDEDLALVFPKSLSGLFLTAFEKALTDPQAHSTPEK